MVSGLLTPAVPGIWYTLRAREARVARPLVAVVASLRDTRRSGLIRFVWSP
jgi:hypothetical protein